MKAVSGKVHAQEKAFTV